MPPPDTTRSDLRRRTKEENKQIPASVPSAAQRNSPFVRSAVLYIVTFIVLLAGVIGVIGWFAPTVFLRIPDNPIVAGWQLWKFTGNPVPPFFLKDAWADDEVRSWARSGDLVVATGTKSGTHWMLYCSHQIRTHGDGDWYDVLTDTPWVDIIHEPGQTWATMKDLMNTTVLQDGTVVKDRWDSPSYPFRIFKTHFPPRSEKGGVLPVRENPDIKFLAMARNGLDVIVSLASMYQSRSDIWRNRWGGFPPKFTAAQMFDFVMPGGFMYHFWFPYIRGWWAFRNEPNVLLLHYADAKQDLQGTVEKIAAFLEVELSGRELLRVVDKCGFQHMKSIEGRFRGVLWASDGASMGGQTIRGGRNGDGDGFVTPEQRERWEEALVAELPDPVMRNWALHGGSMQRA